MKHLTCSTPLLFLFLLLLQLVSSPVNALDDQYRIRHQSRHQQSNHSLLFPAQDNSAHFAAIDISIESEGFRLAATVWSESIDGDNKQASELSELFYDFSWADWQLSIGKKKLDWDVGYGFRPLDMFSPTDKLALNTAAAPGAWMMSADWFTDSGTLSFVCNESQQNVYIANDLVDDGIGCGGRYYQYAGDWEFQALYHFDSEVKSRVGVSALTILSDNAEFHSSLLWQHRYHKTQFNPDSIVLDQFNNPFITHMASGAWQYLAGINYNLQNGTQFILEYWFDGRSPKHDEWEGFIDTTQNQSHLINDYPIISHYLSAERQMFSSHNLFQHNIMLHTQNKVGNWQPEATLVLNPLDKGLLFTARLCYYFDSGHQLALGARWFSGPEDSVYQQLDYSSVFFLGTEFRF